MSVPFCLIPSTDSVVFLCNPNVVDFNNGSPKKAFKVQRTRGQLFNFLKGVCSLDWLAIRGFKDTETVVLEFLKFPRRTRRDNA